MQMMFLALGGLFLIIMSGAVLAKESDDETLSIGVEAMNYCPILCFEGDEPSGFLVELLDKLQQKTGVAYQLLPYAIPRLNQEFRNDNIDVKFPDNPAWSRGEKTQFSVAIIPYRDAFFSLPVNPDSTLSKITSAAIPPGFHMPKSIRADIDIMEASSVSSMFNMLEHGRVDAVYLNYLVAFNHAKRQELNIIERTDYPSDNSYFHFRSVKNPDFIQHVNNMLLHEPEMIKELLFKYELE